MFYVTYVFLMTDDVSVQSGVHLVRLTSSAHPSQLPSGWAPGTLSDGPPAAPRPSRGHADTTLQWVTSI